MLDIHNLCRHAGTSVTDPNNTLKTHTSPPRKLTPQQRGNLPFPQTSANAGGRLSQKNLGWEENLWVWVFPFFCMANLGVLDLNWQSKKPHGLLKAHLWQHCLQFPGNIATMSSASSKRGHPQVSLLPHAFKPVPS